MLHSPRVWGAFAALAFAVGCVPAAKRVGILDTVTLGATTADVEATMGKPALVEKTTSSAERWSYPLHASAGGGSEPELWLLDFEGNRLVRTHRWINKAKEADDRERAARNRAFAGAAAGALVRLGDGVSNAVSSPTPARDTPRSVEPSSPVSPPHDFCSGYSAGYRAGVCYQSVGCYPQIPPLCPIARIGERSPQDGYNRGFLDGLHAQ